METQRAVFATMNFATSQTQSNSATTIVDLSNTSSYINILVTAPILYEITDALNVFSTTQFPFFQGKRENWPNGCFLDHEVCDQPNSEQVCHSD